MHYIYNIKTGLERAKTNTKKFVLGGFTALTIVGGLSGAVAAAPAVSSEANSNACFGQARAYYAQGGPNGVLAPNSNGTYISERKGTNPENNAAYIAQNC